MKIDITFLAAEDKFEVCYRESDTNKETVFHVPRGDEDLLIAAFQAAREITGGEEQWDIHIEQKGR